MYAPEDVVDGRGAVLAEAGAEQRAHEFLHPSAAAGRAHDGRGDERQGARVRLGQRVQAHEELTHASLPAGIRRRRSERRRGDRLADAVEDGLLAGEVVVEAHRLDAGLGGQTAHVQCVDAVLVDDLHGDGDDAPRRQSRATERGLFGDGHGDLHVGYRHVQSKAYKVR